MKDSLQLVSSCNCLQGCWGSQGDKGTGQGTKGIGGQEYKGGKWDKGTRGANGIRGTRGQLTSLYGGILLLPGNSLPL